MGALENLLVADFSRVLAGPFATMTLGDLGATVIKVERPGAGDDTRSWGPPYGASHQSTYYESVNRNKRSIALDLTNAADLAIARELAQTADVLVENFKPGGLATFGLDYQTVSVSNPGLVYASISGFGSGAGAELPGYDLLVQAMGGLMSITGAQEPSKAGVAVVDVLTGMQAVIGILAALNHRHSSGRGQHVEVSLLGTLLSALVNQSSGFVGAGVIPERLGNAHPSISPYEVYQAKDRPLVIAVGNDSQFARLCTLLGHPEVAVDRDFATNPMRVANRDRLNILLNTWLRSESADHWQAVLNEGGVPCGPINNIAQAFDLASSLGLDPVQEIADSTQVSNAMRFSLTPVRYDLAPPGIDADRASVLALLAERR